MRIASLAAVVCAVALAVAAPAGATIIADLDVVAGSGTAAWQYSQTLAAAGVTTDANGDIKLAITYTVDPNAASFVGVGFMPTGYKTAYGFNQAGQNTPGPYAIWWGAKDSFHRTVQFFDLSGGSGGWYNISKDLPSASYDSAGGTLNVTIHTTTHKWDASVTDSKGTYQDFTGQAYTGSTAMLTVYSSAVGHVTITQVPEPATMGLLAIGGLAAIVRRRRA